jgi:Bacterial regulatory helix-turn-helix protein, lysR family
VLASRRRLLTSQPSLSRQIRDLEDEVGAPLFNRGARGVELTASGQAFLDHARLALSQVDTTTEAAGRAARPTKQVFALGSLTSLGNDLPAAPFRYSAMNWRTLTTLSRATIRRTSPKRWRSADSTSGFFEPNPGSISTIGWSAEEISSCLYQAITG